VKGFVLKHEIVICELKSCYLARKLRRCIYKHEVIILYFRDKFGENFKVDQNSDVNKMVVKALNSMSN